MKYLLDTNVCISFLNQRNATLTNRFLSYPATEKVICSIVRMELHYGAEMSQRRQTYLNDLDAFLSNYPNLDFDQTAARLCGTIRADLRHKGTPIGHYDLQIAAIGLANDLTLVTHNTAEFSRIANLQLEDWEI